MVQTTVTVPNGKLCLLRSLEPAKSECSACTCTSLTSRLHPDLNFCSSLISWDELISRYLIAISTEYSFWIKENYWKLSANFVNWWYIAGLQYLCHWDSHKQQKCPGERLHWLVLFVMIRWAWLRFNCTKHCHGLTHTNMYVLYKENEVIHHCKPTPNGIFLSSGQD